MKRIIKGIKKSSVLHDRLLYEAHLLKNLKHPFIPEIYDVEEDGEYSYIIEEYIDGKSLKSLCSSRLLSEKEVFLFTIRISNIIEYLHRLPGEILYLDLKPENIIVSGKDCYLVDFGSAQSSETDGTYCFGTAGYAAPEQFEGGKTGHRTDIYAMGKLLGYIIEHANLTGGTRKKLLKIAEGCCAGNYWDRTGSAAAFTAKLEKLYRKTDIISEKNIRIAFAGAAPNSGTTYLALLTGLYLAGQGRECAFVEADGKGTGPYFTGRERDQTSIAGLRLVSSKYREAERLPDCSLVFDYGVLTSDTDRDFFEADISCIIIGKMAWEQKEAAHAGALSLKCRNCLFIVNPADNLNNIVLSVPEGAECITFPYCPEFAYANRNGNVNEKLKELLLLAEGKHR